MYCIQATRGFDKLIFSLLLLKHFSHSDALHTPSRCLPYHWSRALRKPLRFDIVTFGFEVAGKLMDRGFALSPERAVIGRAQGNVPCSLGR